MCKIINYSFWLDQANPEKNASCCGILLRGRLVAIALAATEACGVIGNIIKLPFETLAYAITSCAYCSKRCRKWNANLKPSETLGRIFQLFYGALSTATLGLCCPSFNYTMQTEVIGLKQNTPAKKATPMQTNHINPEGSPEYPIIHLGPGETINSTRKAIYIFD